LTAVTRRLKISQEATIAGSMNDRSDQKPCHVLLVDDDPRLVLTLALLLRRAGYVISECGDGEDALAMLHDGLRPDAIVVDVRMPKMDGYTFRDQQARTPSLAGIPVILHTSDPTARQRSTLFAFYLPKGATHHELMAAIDEIVVAARDESSRRPTA
jgi:CheY-like chemotaxis protein